MASDRNDHDELGRLLFRENSSIVGSGRMLMFYGLFILIFSFLFWTIK